MTINGDKGRGPLIIVNGADGGACSMQDVNIDIAQLGVRLSMQELSIDWIPIPKQKDE